MGLLLSKYVDNEATADERARVEQHLPVCTPCKEMLSIFLRNESMLSKAVARDEFGARIVDGVMDEIEGPTEAEPTEATRWERASAFLRERPWMPMAASLLLFLGVTVVILLANSSSERKVRKEMADLQRAMKETRQATLDSAQNEQRRNEALTSRLRQLHSDLLREKLKNSLEVGSVFAHIDYDALVVRTRMANRDQFVSYTVWRSEDDGKNYARLRSDLPDSQFEDASVEPGKTYWYKFTGRKRNLDTEESLPFMVQAPPRGLDPQKCLRVQCLEIGPNLDVATFAVTRLVNRQAVTYYFTVLRGQSIGRPETTPHGLVDFTTGLQFESAEQGDETLKATFVTPKIDPDTKQPIYDTQNRPAFDYRDEHLGTRPNKRAVLKGRGGMKVWQDSEFLLPIEK